MNPVIEEIKSRINVVDFIGEYIRLQKGGANWKAPCPFHREKSPSFMVSDEKQIWHCFGCGKGGDIFSFLMEMDGLEFPEAIRVLAERAGVQLPTYGGKKELAVSFDKAKILEILELAAKFYEKQLWDGAGKQKIMEYLLKRGISHDSIKTFRLGYAPAGWRNLLEFLVQRGYDIKDIESSGLLVKKSDGNVSVGAHSEYYDRFRDRITFPIFDLMGKAIGFSARVAPGGDESQAKYVNTPETPVYHKSKALYGIEKAKGEIKNKEFTLLVEGNTDVIASHQAGVKNTVAVSGTALTSEQLDILKRYSNNVKLLFDMDEAGRQATLRSAELAFQKDLDVFVAVLPEGKDAAELLEKNKGAFLNAVEKALPAMEYFFQTVVGKYDKKSAQGKKLIVRELLDIIANFKNEIEKNHWLKKISEYLDIPEQTLVDMAKKNGTKGSNDRNDPGTARQDDEKLKNRAEMLKENIEGIMLAYPEAWRMAVEKYRENDFFREDIALQLIISKGEEADYAFENLMTVLESDQKTIDYLQKIYFGTRYKFGGKNGTKEIWMENPSEMLEKCVRELEKEQKKKVIETILEDIKKAEQSGDKEGMKILIDEFQKISKELK